MGTIQIEDLEVAYHVGVGEEERSQPQRLLVSIVMEADLAAAATSDDIHATIDYYQVTRRLLQFGDGRSWKLIERLASDIADFILEQFGPLSVEVTIKKFVIPETQFVAVRLKKNQQDA